MTAAWNVNNLYSQSLLGLCSFKICHQTVLQNFNNSNGWWAIAHEHSTWVSVNCSVVVVFLSSFAWNCNSQNRIVCWCAYICNCSMFKVLKRWILFHFNMKLFHYIVFVFRNVQCSQKHFRNFVCTEKITIARHSYTCIKYY